MKTLMKSITKKSTALNLCGMKMSQLPLCMRPIPPARASHRDSARNIYEFNNNGLHLSGSVESNENMFGGLGNGLSINQCLAATVTHVNLSKNNLFNSEEIFTVSFPLIACVALIFINCFAYWSNAYI